MKKAEYGAVIAKVRELCARPIGASLKETAAALDRPQNAASVYINNLVKAGEVVKVGPYGEYRYFKDRKKAAAHDVIAQAERAKQTEEYKKRKNARKAQKAREKCAKERAEKGLPPYVKRPSAGIRNPLRPRRTQDIVIQSTRQSKEQLREHKAATIVWHEHVQIQRIPTPPDMRFKPEHGYIGSFLQDWHDRRAA